MLLTVARGLTNSEIADELHISLSTVKTHLTALMNKLGARNRVELVMWAYETGRSQALRRAGLWALVIVGSGQLIGLRWVSRTLLPDGSRKPLSMP